MKRARRSPAPAAVVAAVADSAAAVAVVETVAAAASATAGKIFRAVSLLKGLPPHGGNPFGFSAVTALSFQRQG